MVSYHVGGEAGAKLTDCELDQEENRVNRQQDTNPLTLCEAHLRGAGRLAQLRRAALVDCNGRGSQGHDGREAARTKIGRNGLLDKFNGLLAVVVRG